MIIRTTLIHIFLNLQFELVNAQHIKQASCDDIIDNKFLHLKFNKKFLEKSTPASLNATYYTSEPYIYRTNGTLKGMVPDILDSIHSLCGIDIQLAHESKFKTNLSSMPEVSE